MESADIKRGGDKTDFEAAQSYEMERGQRWWVEFVVLSDRCDVMARRHQPPEPR